MEEFDIFNNNKKYPDASQIFDLKVKSKEEIKDKCLFLIDTNALLIPYTVSSHGLEEIRNFFKKIIAEKRFFIPAQVAREFANNRPNKLTEVFQKLVRYRDGFQTPKLEEHPILQSTVEFDSLQSKKEDYDLALKRLREEVQNVIHVVENWNWDDPVSLTYKELFNKDLIIEHAIIEDKFKENLKYRYKHKIPPGYKDNSREDEGIGDLLIWETIIKIAKEKKQDIIFITGDNKADWKHRSEKKGLYPRFELTVEFKQKCDNKDLLLLELSEALKLFGISPETVKEVKSIEKEYEKIMKRKSVSSSNLASVGYDADKKILEIEFNHGGVYQYFDVPQDTYDELMAADSHGRYFVHNIKDDYEFNRLK